MEGLSEDKNKEASNNSEQSSSIGTAWMEEDGTICLRLMAKAEDGTTGQGLLRYAQDDAHYQSVLEHLGAFAPGEIKSVLPFPD
jgi:hypothetical protein